ncbi:MAG: proprotein convertase P-domain-containing protein, partial [Verrucomicrobiota bacterium]
ADLDVLEPTPVERRAISNALALGRGGRGVVMVRSSGNTRERSLFGRSGVGDANLDGFANDPASLTVGSVRRTGRAASYSTPGACLLVAAPGGEKSEGSEVFSTDPVGDAGLSTVASAGAELSSYAFAPRVPAGTSFSAPEVSGIVAVMLEVRPELTAPEVALALALGARQLDPEDPLLRTNRAGLRFSPNTGFGVPDAGEAVRVARSLPRRPSPVRVTVSRREPLPIPDDGLRVRVTGSNIPPARASLPASGGTGLHPDAPTADRPLRDVGQATGPIGESLRDQAALIQRGPNDFAEKIAFAAAAGASFVVLWNNVGLDERLVLLRTDFAPIPAVLVGRADGEALRSLVATNPSARVRLELVPARQTFQVTQALAADFVQVRLQMEHPRLADLRVTLLSPSGTRSVLHRAGAAANPQPAEWFYGSRAHLLEPTTGTWTLEVSDQAPGSTGSVIGADLILTGTPLEDADADGLDDRWERAWLGGLAGEPGEDPDRDDRPHAVEQALGSDPTRDDRPWQAGIAPISGGRLRLSWPGRAGWRTVVESASDPAGPFAREGSGWGSVFEGSFFVARPDPARFLRLRVEVP